jgi:hypothetical protein
MKVPKLSFLKKNISRYIIAKLSSLKKSASRYLIEGDAPTKNEISNSKVDISQKNILISSVDEFFKNDTITQKDVADAHSVSYWGSQYQRMQYDQLIKRDPLYEQYIIQNYGSYDNFQRINLVGESLDVFNPFTDYKIDVTIITEDKYYKTDHISPFEIISESLTGLCTIDYLKVNGSADRLTGTLQKKYILPSKIVQRSHFFFPMQGNRIGMWNVIKQKWSSFYMSRVIRFVRDDTTGLE